MLDGRLETSAASEAGAARAGLGAAPSGLTLAGALHAAPSPAAAPSSPFPWLALVLLAGCAWACRKDS